MYMGILITGLLLTVVLLGYKFLRPALGVDKRKRQDQLPGTVTAMVQPFSKQDTWYSITANTNTSIAFDYVWWKALGNLDQLHLALLLAHKALPVWEKYAASQDMIYKNSPTVAISKINHQLLAKALAEVQLQSNQLFPVSRNAAIKQYYYHFVGPVIALQDDNWAPPYHVKKIFLSVYNILKSILEQDNTSAVENFLSIAINQSIDCMDITKLYSKPEIIGFLQVYKNRL